MESIFTALAALFQVVLIDLALAGDNAVAVGLAAAALPAAQQKKAIFWGVGLALVLRISFATATLALLQIHGLLLLGGLLLFWVAWRMWSDLQAQQPVMVGEPAAGEQLAETIAKVAPASSFGRALLTIVIADVSMSLDNVLAVAAVSKHNMYVMWFGLVLSVLLMGVAASVIARVIDRHRWIAIVGVIFIVFAGARMIWEDGHNFLPTMIAPLPTWLGGHPG
jgi:YjbE family integral membrane protein